MTLTDYQRGNRDGLLSLADELHKHVQREQEEIRRLAKKDVTPGTRLLLATAGARFSAYQEAERMARSAADALPEDPGEDPIKEPTETGDCDTCRFAGGAEECIGCYEEDSSDRPNWERA